MTSPLTLAVVSGKGGVGKSVVSANLAETFAASGRRVALVDADFGQSACPVLLNESPPATALDVATGRADPSDALHTTESGITLFQGVRTPGEADGHEAELYDALDIGLDALCGDHDVVLIDAPAGTGPAVRWALDRAGAGLLVLVGEPTAVADAYGLAKLVWSAEPGFPLGTVVNFADTESEAQSVAARFAAVTKPFLGSEPSYLGWVPYAVAVRRSVKCQRPAVREPGATRLAFDALATAAARGPASWASAPAAL